MHILLLSDSGYLSGLFKGYCVNAACDVKTISNCKNFYKSLNNNPPRIVFIDMALLPQLMPMTDWLAAQSFIRENNIILCGFGTQPFDKEKNQSSPVFKKIFPFPSNDDEILIFLKKTLIENELLIHDRRQGDRRKNTERRKSWAQVHATPLANELHSSMEDIKIGSLIINRAHKIITINNAPVVLSQTEFKIIDLLVKNLASVVKTEDIINNVWAECSTATKADVHQYVHMLRKKLESDPHNPKLIVTVKGIGYELCP